MLDEAQVQRFQNYIDRAERFVLMAHVSPDGDAIGAAGHLPQRASVCRAEEADDEYRRERDKLRDESDTYLDNAAQALEAEQSTNELFTINWEVC